MQTTITVEQLTALLPEATVAQGSQFITIEVPNNKYLATVEMLKQQRFDFFLNMTGVDNLPALEIRVHLRNSATWQTIVVHTSTDDRENPSFDSIHHLWKGVGYFEREVFDLLGIKFNGHPDLRRMFLDDDYPGFPLRKDFVDPYNPPLEK